MKECIYTVALCLAWRCQIFFGIAVARDKVQHQAQQSPYRDHPLHISLIAARRPPEFNRRDPYLEYPLHRSPIFFNLSSSATSIYPTPPFSSPSTRVHTAHPPIPSLIRSTFSLHRPPFLSSPPPPVLHRPSSIYTGLPTQHSSPYQPPPVPPQTRTG